MKLGLFATACLLSLGFTGSAALAETATAPADGAQLAEIVVTAQRTSESLQRAAVAVSAISGESLMKAGVTQPTQLTKVVPSLQVSTSAGPYALFYLRGVGNFSANALSESAIAFNFDGVFVSRPSAVNGFFYDLERVEVLKGPQGTLYGRNATGGAINVISKKPEMDVTGGDFTAEYGNYDAVRLDGAVNVPAGDKAAFRFAASYVRHDGYMKDGADDQDDFGARLSARFEPTHNLSINAAADYFRQRGHGAGGQPATSDKDARWGLGSAEGAAFLAGQPNVLLGRTLAPLATLDPYLHNDYYGVAATIEWRTDHGTLTLIPAHRESRLNFLTNTPGFRVHQHERDKQDSFEGRFATDANKPVRTIFGGFLFRESNKVPLFTTNLQANMSRQSFRPESDSEAVFGRLTWAVTPEFRLTLGGRHTWENKQFSGLFAARTRICVRPTTFFPTYVPGCPTAQPIPYTDDLPAPNFVPDATGTITLPTLIDETGANRRKANFRQATYHVGANWDVTPSNLLYVSYETGYKSGGFFFSSDAGAFKPETLKALTLGSKNRFLDNRLQLNLEIFDWKYRNQQISHVSTDSRGNTIFPTENVGRASMRGIEVETQYLLTPDTLLTADIEYLKAEYKRFVYSIPNLNNGASNGTSCPNDAISAVIYTVNCSGRTPPNAPKWSLNLGGEQTFHLGGGGRVVADVRAHYQTRSLTGLEFTAPEYQSSYWNVDAQLTYYTADKRFNIGIFGYNIFDDTVKAQSIATPLTFFTTSALRPPRTYGVRVGAQF